VRFEPKAFLANAALLATTLAIFYVVGSIVLFLLPSLPPVVLRALPLQLRVLGQNTKAERIPQDYVALFGDSYAEGIGDWLARRDPRGRYHSAHVIRDLTGRDVVSFGQSAAGSPEALVRLPKKALGTGLCESVFGMPQPSEMFVYFYEGNDFVQNARYARRRAPGYDGSPGSVVHIDEALRAFATVSVPHCATHLGYFLSALIRIAYYSLPFVSSPPNLSTIPVPTQTEQHVLAAGKRVKIPERLQSPPISLDDANLKAAAAIFDRALAWLMRQFPSVPLTVVYVPSPASVYLFPDSAIEVSELELGEMVSVEALRRISDAGCTLIYAGAKRNGARFLDARPAIRAAARRGVVHGPMDWDHFNEAGYTALGKLVAEHVGDQGGDIECDSDPEFAPPDAQRGPVWTGPR